MCCVMCGAVLCDGAAAACAAVPTAVAPLLPLASRGADSDDAVLATELSIDGGTACEVAESNLLPSSCAVARRDIFF